MPTPRKHKTHAERQKAYRERKRREDAEREKDQSAAILQPEDTPVAAVAPSTDTPTMQALIAANPSLAVLEGIRDNPKALDSDRIRASVEIGRLQALESEQRQGGSDLVDLRAIIEALPVGERLAYLKGELDEHRAAALIAQKEGA